MCRIVAVLPLLAVTSASAADFDAGSEAFDHGDYEMALRERQPLAEQGHVGAQFIVGSIYANGQGVPRDDGQAYAWFNLASTQEDEDAVEERELIR